MAHLQGTADTASPKLLESLKAYLSCWMALLRTRLEIICCDLEEERARFSQIVLVALASGFLVVMGVFSLTFLFVAIFWDHRVAVLTGFTTFYFLGGIAAGLIVRHKIKSKPKLFATTLAELKKDEHHLST